MSEHEISRSKSLLISTVIYFVGTFISKGLSFLMIPFLTTVLTTKQYGDFDLISTMMMLIMPIFTLQTIEAVFRFLFDADEKRIEEVLTTVWLFVLLGSLLFAGVLWVFPELAGSYSRVLICAYYVATIGINMYQRVARSLGLNKCFAFSGIIQSVFLVITQFAVLYCMKPSVNGLLLSYVFATLLACIYLEIKTESIRRLSLKRLNLSCLKEMIQFGAPLVPNNVSWWAASAINKIIITTTLGAAANGIYAVAFKFSTLIQTITNVFQLSWQENVIVAFGEKGSDAYNSKIANIYVGGLLCSASVCLGIIRAGSPYFIGSNFHEAIILIPPLVFGACFAAISQFYGAGYIASRKTKGALYTTVFGALINILLCCIGIHRIKLIASALATMFAYFIIWILRIMQMKSFFPIKLSVRTIRTSIFYAVVATGLFYYGNTKICIIGTVGLSILLFKTYGKDALIILKRKRYS